MAHWTKPIGRVANRYVGSTSRYSKSKVLLYGEDKHVTFEIYKRRKQMPSPNDQWLQITKPLEYRPDLVSQELYGAPDFWWRIMEYNGMKDVLEFKAGQSIRIPGDILW